MTKSELIEILSARQGHLKADDVDLAVKSLLEMMGASLSGGERIEIRGFGSFSLHYRPPRLGRNPKTGDKVDVQILDIQRAGQYEWNYGAARDLRVLRDIYPPRIQLRFRRMDANGNVVAEGDRKLADLAYLMSPPPLPASDTLRYEKRLIDQWVRREFVTRR